MAVVEVVLVTLLSVVTKYLTTRTVKRRGVSGFMVERMSSYTGRAEQLARLTEDMLMPLQTRSPGSAHFLFLTCDSVQDPGP